MNYATQQNLVARFGEEEIIALTDRDGDDVADPEVLDQALGDAAETIDGYVGARYELPFETAPAVLIRVACDLARYYLYDDAAPELIAKRHDTALALLRDIAAGKVSLGVDSDEAPASADAPEFAVPPRTFDDETLAGYAGR